MKRAAKKTAAQRKADREFARKLSLLCDDFQARVEAIIDAEAAKLRALLP